MIPDSIMDKIIGAGIAIFVFIITNTIKKKDDFKKDILLRLSEQDNKINRSVSAQEKNYAELKKDLEVLKAKSITNDDLERFRQKVDDRFDQTLEHLNNKFDNLISIYMNNNNKD